MNPAHDFYKQFKVGTVVYSPWHNDYGHIIRFARSVGPENLNELGLMVLFSEEEEPVFVSFDKICL